MDFKPLYYDDKINVINPQGYAGIVTLWTPVEDIIVREKSMAGFRPRLQEAYPALFQEDSPLVTVTSLFGNGLPQMLANLANNPQIERIAITGTDSKKSGEALMNFFSQGVEEVSMGGVELCKIKGIDGYVVDSQLKPEIFNPNIKIEKFGQRDLEAITNFISQPSEYQYEESQRKEIELVMPEFNDFPSDITNHNITAETPLDAWMDIMYHLDRFGVNIDLPKGTRRALFNLDVIIKNPDFESDDKLKKFNFDPEGLRKYKQDMINPDQGEQPYTYGNRLREYWSGDCLKVIGEKLKKDPLNRHGLVSLWDSNKDLVMKESSAPCFSDAYFVSHEDKLMMTAHFRTHNAVAAWLENIYGLRSIQEKVSEFSGIEPGQLNIRSRWIGIDPENAKTVSALELVKKNRRIPLNVSDPRGYITVTADKDKNELVAQHYHPTDGVLLREYKGPDVGSIKDQLRQDSVISNSDHAMWIGYELARAYHELTGELPEL